MHCKNDLSKSQSQFSKFSLFYFILLRKFRGITSILTTRFSFLTYKAISIKLTNTNCNTVLYCNKKKKNILKNCKQYSGIKKST